MTCARAHSGRRVNSPSGCCGSLVCDRARGRADDGSGAKLHEVLAVFLPIATGDENGLSDPLAVTGGSCLMTALVLWRVSRDRGGCLRRAKFNPTRLGQICFAQGSLAFSNSRAHPGRLDQDSRS